MFFACQFTRQSRAKLLIDNLKDPCRRVRPDSYGCFQRNFYSIDRNVLVILFCHIATCRFFRFAKRVLFWATQLRDG